MTSFLLLRKKYTYYNEGENYMTTNQKLYLWHEIRMTAGVVITATMSFITIYATSPWLREKCHDVKDNISNKIHKK